MKSKCIVKRAVCDDCPSLLAEIYELFTDKELDESTRLEDHKVSETWVVCTPPTVFAAAPNLIDILAQKPVTSHSDVEW